MNWQASWIWGGSEQSPRNEWRCFRREFDIPATGTKGAKLAITADSRYILYVNGTQLGRGPVRSWPSEQFYDTYEVGHLLIPGKRNVIAVLVMHFGVSTFYYIRGRGGLLAQLEYEDSRQITGTDGVWKTSKHEGQHSRASRMSCQQAFSEYVDASAWNSDWYSNTFDDSDWEHASVLGPVGMEPWTLLQPRDIPSLTEEIVYPVRIESLAKIRTFQISTALDVRAALVTGSEDHANPVQLTGYVSTIIRASRAATATFGFLAWGECFRGCSLNGEIIDLEQSYGEAPSRCFDVNLNAGDNLLLIDVSGGMHTGKLQIGIYAEGAVKLDFIQPLSLYMGDSPFLAIGPFDSLEIIDHQASRELNWKLGDYQKVLLTIKQKEDLMEYENWLRPIAQKFLSEVDVFSLCVWRKENIPLTVPYQLQNVVIPNNEPGLIPLYEGFDTEVIIDFGKEYSGYLRFELEATEGTILDWYGYEYSKNGWRQDTYGLDHTLRYITKEGRQIYETPIRRGFRYMALNVREAKTPIILYRVMLRQSNYPVAEIGRFQCSDPLLNDIWEISRHTTKLCMEDTFVDCPTYEQVFWVGDSRNESLVNNYLYGAKDIVKRCLRLVPGSKNQTPLYADQVPSGWSSVIPNWTFFWIIACSEYYRQTADLDFAKEMYTHIRYTIDHYLQKIDSKGLLNMRGWNFLDWSAMDQPKDGIVTHQNMFLVQALLVTAELGRLTSNEGEAIAFVDAARKLTQAINDELWDEQQQAYIDCIHADGRRSEIISMQTQVVAALSGVAQAEKGLVIEQYLLNPPMHFVQIGSPFMSFFYYEALTNVNSIDGAALILNDIRNQYENMINHGATTCWEQYPNFSHSLLDSAIKLTRSHCHAWSAAPAYFLGKQTLGISSLSPGWNEVLVAPKPCGLKWACGSVPHPNGGRIDVAWESDADNKKMDISVNYPFDVKVKIRLPNGFTGKITEFQMNN